MKTALALTQRTKNLSVSRQLADHAQDTHKLIIETLLVRFGFALTLFCSRDRRVKCLQELRAEISALRLPIQTPVRYRGYKLIGGRIDFVTCRDRPPKKIFN